MSHSSYRVVVERQITKTKSEKVFRPGRKNAASPKDAAEQIQDIVNDSLDAAQYLHFPRPRAKIERLIEPHAKPKSEAFTQKLITTIQAIHDNPVAEISIPGWDHSVIESKPGDTDVSSVRLALNELSRRLGLPNPEALVA